MVTERDETRPVILHCTQNMYVLQPVLTKHSQTAATSISVYLQTAASTLKLRTQPHVFPFPFLALVGSRVW